MFDELTTIQMTAAPATATVAEWKKVAADMQSDRAALVADTFDLEGFRL